MHLKWLGTRTFIANSTVSGISAGYFFITGMYPIGILIIILWMLSLVTWAEYRNALID